MPFQKSAQRFGMVLRHPSFLMITTAISPTSHRPISPIKIWIPQISNLNLCESCSDINLPLLWANQIKSCAKGSQDIITKMIPMRSFFIRMVRVKGFEPPAFGTGNQRSIQLSYTRKVGEIHHLTYQCNHRRSWTEQRSFLIWPTGRQLSYTRIS